MKKMLLILLLFISLSLFAVDDIAGNCLDFDGVDDYVQVGTSGSIGLSTQCTIEAWINVPGTIPDGTRGGAILGKYGHSPNFNFEVYYNGQLRIYWNGGNPNLYSVNVDLRDDTWHHIAMVRDVTTNSMKLYVDGVLNNSSSAGINIDVQWPMKIGDDFRSGTGSGIPFNGMIDEVRIWNTARTQTEIQANMNSALTGSETGLISYWQFNESSGTTAPDAAGSNDGTLNNMTDNDWVLSDIPFAIPNDMLGSGTSGDPYQISDLDDLQWLSGSSYYWNVYFIQTADIDASATSTWNSGAGFSPIGNNITNFTGIYDGQGYEVDSLFIFEPFVQYKGLFGLIDNAEISNTGVTNVNITGYHHTGGLIGRAENNSSITYCYSTGNVYGNDAPGDGSVFCGGLVGYNHSTTISNCYSTVEVDAEGDVGGLVGRTYASAVISNCYSKGDVTATNNYVGGFVGLHDNSSTISNCYSTGSASGSNYVGGFAGRTQSSSTVNNSFWDTETSGQSSSAGGTDKTTAEMKDIITFTDTTTVGLNTAWDFVGNPNDDTGNNDEWHISVLYNDGYPQLSWEHLPNVTTTIAVSVSQNSTETGGEVLTEGDTSVTARGVCWSTDSNPTIADSVTTDGSGTGIFTSYITNLNPFTTYYYRAYATNTAGTVYGDEYPFTTVSDIAGNCLEFDGSTDEYVQVGTIGSIGLSDECTVEAWVKIPSTLPAGTWGGTIFGNYQNTLNFNFEIIADGVLRIWWNNGEVNFFSTGIDLMDDQWHHVAMVRDLNDSSIKMYIDGNLNNSSTAGSNIDLEWPFRIGNDFRTGGSPFHGMIDEVRLWNTARTQTEIQAKMRSALEGSESGLVSYWQFNESSGTTATDPVGSNDGTLINMTDDDWVTSTVLFCSFAGAGTSSDPFQISSLLELRELSENSTLWNSHFIQTTDIDATDTQNWNSGDGFSPIGSFTGQYDGQSYEIDGLFIYRPTSDNIGLFGLVQNSNTLITNLGLTNVDITGRDKVGGLAGYYYQVNNLTNCYSSGSVTGRQYVGGLIGFCTLGLNITNCYSAGSVLGSYSVGGLVGLQQGNISNSYSTSDVTGTEYYIGGLVGSSYGGAMTNCYSRGDVTGNYHVGGLIGEYSNYFNLTNCYSTGEVVGNYGVGGLIGFGDQSMTATNCFWDTETSGTTTGIGTGMTSSDIIGKTTTEMQTMTTYLHASWDFMEETVNGTEDVWGMNSSDNNGYPFLSWQGYDNFIELFNGSGTELDPYRISTLEDLLWLSEFPSYWSSHFIQTADIDATATQSLNGGAGFSPIGIYGTAWFTGSYNGQGHEITGLYINRPGTTDLGLFGIVGNTEISNLGMINVDITGDNTHIAGLVGYCQNTTVMNCYITGTVSGANSTGGLVGFTDTSNINNCYNNGSVAGTDAVGGLVGYNAESTINNSYSIGTVSGNVAGGLIGYNISGTTDNSFWDTDTSLQATSAGGTGLTTSQMQRMGTFTDAGWDFMGETTNGSDDHWGINEVDNGAYPFLSWQGYALGTIQPEGSGTTIDPYQISTLGELLWLSEFPSTWSSRFIQTADIDAGATSTWNGGAGFSPIGNDSDSFTGVYDGQGFVIEGLYIDRPFENNIGLFGYLSNSEISNLGVIDIDMIGWYRIGGLAGILYTNSVLNNCFSTGNVNADGGVGGLVGYVYDNSSVNNCYSTVSVSSNTGEDGLGGLAGYVNESFLNNSYSVGYVDGIDTGGGLIGSVIGSSIIVNSFWDTETSGTETGVGIGDTSGVTGKTTVLMQTLSTFTNAGWDFVGESTNGSDYHWIYFTNNYPFLSWQFAPPVIDAVTDIPADQGHQVKLKWTRASLDDYYSANRFYSVWRQTEDTRSEDGTIKIDTPADIYNYDLSSNTKLILNQRDVYWEFIQQVPAMMYNLYFLTVPTLIDSASTLTLEEYQSTFMVMYHYETGFQPSESQSGYSIDNIAPDAAENIMLSFGSSRSSSDVYITKNQRNNRNTNMVLSWEEVTEGTYQGVTYPEQNGIWYNVYTSSEPDFICDEITYLATTQTTYIDVDITGKDKLFFKIVVSDQPYSGRAGFNGRFGGIRNDDPGGWEDRSRIVKPDRVGGVK